MKDCEKFAPIFGLSNNFLKKITQCSPVAVYNTDIFLFSVFHQNYLKRLKG